MEVAADGDDGFWRASEGSYDLIVLDIMLPGRNGFRVCSDLRAAGIWTPILMLTAKDGDLDEAEALATRVAMAAAGLYRPGRRTECGTPRPPTSKIHFASFWSSHMILID